MLLMKLKNGEKFAFLDIAYYVAYIDGEFEKEEKDIIKEYCAEMGIENVEYGISEFDFEKTLKKIKSKESQRIVLLELMILIHSDNNVHRFEEKIIHEIANYYQISQQQLDIYSQWGKMVSALYSQGKLFLNDNKYEDK